METITKVTKCLQTLKDVLKDEYNTNTIPTFSEVEIEELYRIPVKKNNIYHNLGYGISCNQVIKHNELENHNLHIVFYNFPELGKTSSKVTKTIIEKIKNLYSKNNEDGNNINENDNIIIIINEPLTATINNMINQLNIQLHHNFENNFIKSKVYNELQEKNINLKSKHFRYATIFDINHLQFNALKHELVDPHIVIRDENVINKILDMCNCNKNQLPKILKDDAIGKLKLICVGDICKITRTSKSCVEYDYYRICIN